MNTLTLNHCTHIYHGKVRDVYSIQDQWLVMVASDRISAFDVILPEPIPYKGQVLNQLAAFMLERTRPICKNWLLDTPAPQVAAGLRCIPFKIEMVIRGTLTGHAWRTYQQGKRTLCGAVMPEGMTENQPFAEPIITPSTKAAEGHDEDISPAEIIEQNLCTKEEWAQLSALTRALFEEGKKIAASRGLILADTKYEFGKINGEIYLMDEVHTPDSSRYFLAENFEKKIFAGERPEQLSKEFVREWLMANDFMGKKGQQIPEMTPDWIYSISQRYTDLYEKLTGEPFVPATTDEKVITQQVNEWIEKQIMS